MTPGRRGRRPHPPSPQVQLVGEATRTLAGTLDLARLMNRLTELAQTALGADAVGVWLLDAHASELILRGDVGFIRPELVTRVVQPPGRDVFAWLTERPGPLVLRRLPIGAATGARGWLEAEGARSFLGVPLIGDGTPLGTLGLFRRRGRPFTATDLTRAQALCMPVPAAIFNARLYADQLAHAERTAVLLGIADTLGATLDLPAALDDIAQRAARALGAERCTVVLRREGGALADASLEDAEAVVRRVEVDDHVLVVPIMRKGEPGGVLRFTARGRREWERSAVDLASAIAGQIALLAENARLYGEAQTRADELTALHEVGMTVTSSLDLPTVLDAVVEAALRLMRAPQGAVLELDPADQRLRVRAQRGMSANAGVTLALGQGATGMAAQTREAYFCGDLRRESLPRGDEETGVAGVLLNERARRHGRRATLAVPVISKETVLGAICVFWSEVRERDEREVRLLTGLAQQAAVAIGQARLHGASVRRAEELAALLRAVRTMLGGLDTKTILEAIVEEAAAIAGTPHVSLLLVDREMSMLRLAAVTGEPAPPEHALSLGESYSGQVATSGRPVFVADTRDDPANVLAARDREAGIVSYLGLPVKIRDNVVGVLAFHTTAPRRYSDAELAYLGSFADHAAVALDNGRLYDEAQRALSDLRAMQQRLVQVETLHALGELAGGAAHHLNNLLTIVVGRIQLLRRGADDERTARPLQIVERAAKDAAEVVRRLQQFAGMRRGTPPRAVRLDDIVADVREMTRGRWQDAARAAGLEITVSTALAATPPVAGDPPALRELLTNLVLNAADALPSGGRITIETSVENGLVVLAVSDTGVGMTEDVRRRAHEPFFTTKGVKSTGLGLSVAYGIARRHGGEVTIRSQPGQGTTIRVELPASPETARSAPAAPGPAAGPRRILLVDDEEEVRRALAEMLASAGHAVLAAADGGEALRMLESDPAIDLVVTDLVMPAMTGWELASAIKARRPGLAVGVVTGWGDLPDSQARGHPAVDFVLSKPVMLEDLHAAVARLSHTPK
jgi:signal transduction histidine kinase